MSKLRNGHSVRLKHDQLSGPHVLDLHPTLYKKLHRALRTGTGITVHRHSISGAGWLDKVKDAAKWVGEKILPAVGRIAEKVILPKLESKAEDLARQGFTRLGMGAKYGLPQSLSSGRPVMVQGSGRRKVHRSVHKSVDGAGFFDDIWSGIKSVSGKVADIGIPLAVNLGSKALMGLGGKKRSQGNGLYLPGATGRGYRYVSAKGLFPPGV